MSFETEVDFRTRWHFRNSTTDFSSYQFVSKMNPSACYCEASWRFLQMGTTSYPSCWLESWRRPWWWRNPFQKSNSQDGIIELPLPAGSIKVFRSGPFRTWVLKISRLFRPTPKYSNRMLRSEVRNVEAALLGVDWCFPGMKVWRVSCSSILYSKRAACSAGWHRLSWHWG